MSFKAVFLDRDGTVNVDKDYMYMPEDFQFEAGVTETLKNIYERGYRLIIITNQSGIARGYYTEKDLEKLHLHIQKESKKNGFIFTGFYHCPHLEGCLCRKPGTELIEKAAKEHDIDLSASYMVGDKESDIEAGKRAGLKTVLVGSGNGKRTKENYSGYDHYFENITGLMTILGQGRTIERK